MAALAGVSYSTAAAALRDAPIVRPQTKKAVLEAAETLGYQSNLAASVMASQRKIHRQRSISVATLTMMSSQKTLPSIWRTVDQIAEISEATGLLHQHHNLTALEEAKPLGRTLHAQGVDGLILLRFEPIGKAVLPDIEWNRFHVVSSIREFARSGVTVLRPSYLQQTAELLERVVAHGYRRIGFIWGAHHEINQNDRDILAAWKVFEALSPKAIETCPLLHLEFDTEDSFADVVYRPLKNWVRKHRPDFVIATTLRELWVLQHPDLPPIPFAALHATPYSGDGILPGYASDLSILPALLLDVLVNKVRAGRRGLEPQPDERLAYLPFVGELPFSSEVQRSQATADIS